MKNKIHYEGAVHNTLGALPMRKLRGHNEGGGNVRGDTDAFGTPRIHTVNGAKRCLGRGVTLGGGSFYGSGTG